MINFRTDLAVERNNIYKKENNIENEIDGVKIENTEKENIEISRVEIVNEKGEKALEKPIGNYVTIDIKKMKYIDETEIEIISKVLSDELKNMIRKSVKEDDSILVVGLGNRYVTPDSLGPKVVSKIEVTRHILEYMPHAIPEKTRPVSAISPGVLGITGIETIEILKGITQNTNPKMIIAIDALATRNIERISSSIQLADTGIVPGAGVNNTRKEISKTTLNIPVLAIGIPTVVSLAAITNDENYKDMIVTPKEIDELIENMSKIVSKGINLAM